MNNLLQSLSSQRLRLRVQDSDLKRLLGAVKEGRGHDSKLSDAFYDSLEGVLHDLRSVTIDNHDAEAFLKPVSRIDYPDYYEIIREPMDLQTMLKKVKQKHYKSKIEFQDDLELIWNNCYTYNTGDVSRRTEPTHRREASRPSAASRQPSSTSTNHPLRLCAKRLQEKANRLLKNITDRRDRLDPPLPPELRTPNVNGITTNGHVRKHSATPIPKTTPAPIATTRKAASNTPPPNTARREVTFADSPAFVRSAAGMVTFAELDRAVENENVAGPSKLRHIIEGDGSEEDVDGMEAANGVVGEKRKLTMNGDSRPWKRQRTRSRTDAEPVELWWDATTTSTLLANGLPELRYRSSAAAEGNESAAPLPSHIEPMRKRRRKRPPEKQVPRSLLGLINNNIRTIRRVRRTHDKFLALNLTTEDGTGQAPAMEPPEPIVDERDLDVDVVLDERPWRSRGTGLEVGQEDADECLRWMSTKVLEHAGFQSTSKAALDVLSGVATEYLLNVGRTMRFLCDKYSRRMSAEEIILHTLFESGITHVRDLERYITDDVTRYGNRLTELERKLVNAYNEVTAEIALDDDAFFAEDDEEDGELLMGNFADTFGEDFLGLRELGIASEFGLSSLTIPKRLLRGKNKQRAGQDGAKPKEPPLPYPLPPPFVPLESNQVPVQIGLLRNFYMQRFNEQASRAAPAPLPPPFVKPPPRALSPATLLELELEGRDPAAHASELSRQAESVPNPAYVGAGDTGVGGLSPLELPDDTPPHSRTRVGPLGQVLRPAGASAPAKKKKEPQSQGQGQQPRPPAGDGSSGPGPGGAAPGMGIGLGPGPVPAGPGVLALAAPFQISSTASPTPGPDSAKKSSVSPKKRTGTPMAQFISANA